MTTTMSMKKNSFYVDDDAIEETYSSNLKFRKFKLKWIIKDFEFICKNMKVVESPRFPSTEPLKWYIRLEPTTLREDNREHFQIILKNTDDIKKYVKVIITFFSSGKQINQFYSSNANFNISKEWNKTGAEFHRLFIDVVKTLPKEVTIICQLEIFESGNSMIQKPLSVSLESEKLIKQMECFFNDQVFKDVKFIVGEKEFNAHKTILALRSPVFAAMFKNKMSEEQTSMVEITDIKSTIFDLMLRFIYTDVQTEDMKELAVELFYAADKYQLERLKKLCLNSIYNNISVETVVKILELADLFSISKLKARSKAYLVSCLEEVNESDEYVDLMESRPHLAAEIVKEQKVINQESVDHKDCSDDMIFEFRT